MFILIIYFLNYIKIFPTLSHEKITQQIQHLIQKYFKIHIIF